MTAAAVPNDRPWCSPDSRYQLPTLHLVCFSKCFVHRVPTWLLPALQEKIAVLTCVSTFVSLIACLSCEEKGPLHYHSSSHAQQQHPRPLLFLNISGSDPSGSLSYFHSVDNLSASPVHNTSL
ncbi:hypothetical protein FALCPG4_003357 [Fusarium falciforme]